MNYTYRMLLEALKELSDEHLDMTATVLDTSIGETFALNEVSLLSELSAKQQDDLDVDDDQPLLLI